MKKLVSILSVIVLLMLSVMPAATAATKAGTATLYVKTPNGKCLLVRSAPSKDGEVLYSLSYGAAVKVAITASSSGSWTFIQGTGKKSGGYVMTKYLTATKPAAYDGSSSPAMKNMTAVTPFTVVVNPSRKGGLANLRLYADKSSMLVAKLIAGTRLTVIGESEQWYQVQTEDGSKAGYIHKQFTKLPSAA